MYSDVDKDSLFVRQADEAISLGGNDSSDTYLNIDKIINAIKRTGSDAVHPGYGFLSENGHFAERCEKEGIIFVGPSSYSINVMGSKQGSKELISKKEPTIPLIPGYNGKEQGEEQLIKEGIKIGFPLLIKASAGGGGKGMRIVYSSDLLPNAIQSVKSESLKSFGDDTIILERYFENSKHIEIQIIGDNYGNIVHLNERECTIQRRHQKVIEETPSPTLSIDCRNKMTLAAIKICSLINYKSTATVEFLLDHQNNFYFLEVNTRLQVEHPITEFTTGFDLVEIQIKIAQGFSLQQLNITQNNIKSVGHSIECRLCADDPSNSFFPSTGKIILWKPSDLYDPVNYNYYKNNNNEYKVRYDTGITNDSEISVYYDSLLSKIIVHCPTRIEAIQFLIKILKETVVMGTIKTNIDFLIRIIMHDVFKDGSFNTHFINNYFSDSVLKSIYSQFTSPSHSIIISTFLFDFYIRNSQRKTLHHLPYAFTNNCNKLNTVHFINNNNNNNSNEFKVQYEYLNRTNVLNGTHCFNIIIDNIKYKTELIEYNINTNKIIFINNDIRSSCTITMNLDLFYVHTNQTGIYLFIIHILLILINYSQVHLFYKRKVDFKI